MATEPSAEPPVVFTVEEFARRLKVSRTTMYTLLNAGDVRSITVGRSRRIPASELGRLLGGPPS